MEIKKLRDEEIVYYKAIKKVVKIGDGGHVVLPNKLVGKNVQILYKEEQK